MGKEVVLWANYFNLYSKKEVELYRYSVTIVPDNRGRAPVGKKAKRIIQLLLEDHLFPSYGTNITTDFKSNLISRVELDLDEEDQGNGNQEYAVIYRSEEEDVPAQNAIQYRCRIQFTGSLTLSELVNYLTSTQAGLMFGSKEEIIQALNIVLGYYPKADPSTTTVASSRHFDTRATDRMSLGAGLEVIRGFFMSVRTATARVLVNVQVKNMAFYENGPLDRLMGAFMAGNRGSNLFHLLKFVHGLSIDRLHIVNRNSSGKRIPKVKKVRGFATTDDGRRLPNPPIVPQFGAGAKDVQFYLDDVSSDSSSKPGPAAAGRAKKGKKGVKKAGPDPPPSGGRYISVLDFFKQRYNITIKDPSLPVININGKDNPSYLPAEVCEVTPGQPASTQLTSAQMQQMIRFAVRRPVHNAQSIVTSGGKLLGFEPTNTTLNGFNITVPPKLITVPGRVLNAPVVKYSAPGLVNPRFGGWDMRSVKFATKSDLPSWTYLRISLQSERSVWSSDADFTAKVDELQAKLKDLGIFVTKYLPGMHVNVNVQQVENGIDEWIHRFAINPKRPKLILVIIPDSAMTAVYNRIKYVCDVKEGILNVCVLASKFARANPQYLANVGLKFNLKLGGRNQTLDPSKLGFVGQQKKTMVVGIDVTHPSPGSSTRAPSVAAIVASVDEWLAQWPADIRVQPARQEMVTDLETMFKSRLLLWRERNKTLPDNILVYRDGVSEGQYDIVINEELPAIRAACSALYPASDTKSGKPHISIIIVGKRHNTRFYPTKKEDADRNGNPMNGTVVDRGVTEARNWDFFLQAHTAIQGTARPAHYYVIYDQIFRNLKSTQFTTAADALEDLTHNMCYLYGRATKAVSICPPAYYADLVCTRARCYLSGLFDPSSLTPDTSSVGTGTAAAGPIVPDASLVTIHANVRNAMFYI